MEKAKVDVVIPTIDIKRIGKTVDSLKYLPFNANLIVISGRKTVEAYNEGIRRSSLDVIFMDDDAYLTEETFKDWDNYYPMADIFGFKCLFPDELTIQHAGARCYADPYSKTVDFGHIGFRDIDDGTWDDPRYVCHIGPAVGYYKRHVFDKVGLFAEDYPGVYYEDVDFSFRALKEGFKILYVPNKCIHAYKMTNPDPEGTIKNKQELVERHNDIIAHAAYDFPKDAKEVV